MEGVIVTTIALLVAAGPIISLVQERQFPTVSGTKALVLNMAIAVGFGIYGTFKSGFLGMLPAPQDAFGFALNVLATASVIVAASQAAFHWLLKPARDRR